MGLRERFAPDPRPGWARSAGGLTVEDCARAFGETTPYTVGLEEELMLLDPETLDLTPAIESVFPLLGGDPRYAKELRASTIESVSPVCASAADAEHVLCEARRDLIGAARDVALVGAAGTHPAARARDDITPGDRYADMSSVNA